MKATLLLATTVALASSLSLEQTSANLAKFTAYDCAWARGMLQGFEVGFFKKASFVNSPKCLDSHWQALFVETFTGYNQATFSWINNTVNIQKMLTDLQTDCQFDEALYSYLTFCYDSDQCLITYMFQTLMSKIFQVTTVFNDIAQLVVERPPAWTAAATDIESYANRFGQDVGKILRYATNYDPTLFPPALY